MKKSKQNEQVKKCLEEYVAKADMRGSIIGYVLDRHIPVPVRSIRLWAKKYETMDRRVALNEFPNGDRVSTVFLGLDHSFMRGGPPILFETMIFGGIHDQYQKRYCTWDEAEEGHKLALEIYFSLDKSNHDC